MFDNPLIELVQLNLAWIYLFHSEFQIPNVLESMSFGIYFFDALDLKTYFRKDT